MRAPPVLTGMLLLVLAPTGCVSGGGAGGAAMVGMMGAMAAGGMMMGRGLRHGGGSMSDSTFLALFEPAHLLDQRMALELDNDQVTALEELVRGADEGRIAAETAAQAAHDLLRPVQRAAARAGGSHARGAIARSPA